MNGFKVCVGPLRACACHTSHKKSLKDHNLATFKTSPLPRDRTSTTNQCQQCNPQMPHRYLIPDSGIAHCAMRKTTHQSANTRPRRACLLDAAGGFEAVALLHCCYLSHICGYFLDCNAPLSSSELKRSQIEHCFVPFKPNLLSHPASTPCPPSGRKYAPLNPNARCQHCSKPTTAVTYPL